MSDTTTPEGWEAVMKHRMDGGDIEYLAGSGKWQPETSHPLHWSHKITRRIKQKREPKVGEIWTAEWPHDNISIFKGMIYDVGSAFVCLVYDSRYNTVATDHFSVTHSVPIDKLIEFTGESIDLSLLTGETT